jgi:hypothetical protein
MEIMFASVIILVGVVVVNAIDKNDDENVDAVQQLHLKRRQIHARMHFSSGRARSQHLRFSRSLDVFRCSGYLHFREKGFNGANIGVLRSNNVTLHTSHVTRHTDLSSHLVDDVISRL